MARAQNASTALTVFEGLPLSTRKKLGLNELKALTGAVTIKDRIYAYYQADAQARKTLRHYKRAHGYCGGFPSCIAYTGPDVSMCSACQQECRNQRQGVTHYKRKTTAYGSIREKERMEEKAERDRLKGGSGR